MNLHGGDVGFEEKWLTKYSIEQLKMMAAENGYSAFVTFHKGVNNLRVFWKKVPYQLTAAHLKPAPESDGTWIRVLNPVGEVKTLHDDDPNWGFMPKQALPNRGDIPGCAPVPVGSLSID